jgi:hypothetical protein
LALHSADATKLAVEIVKAAMSSSSFNLSGPSTGDQNSKNIKADAEYLGGLIASLSQSIRSASSRL